MVFHLSGDAYFDMLQLEEGDTANRVNLIRNGAFYFGDETGYTRSLGTEDGITAVNTSVSAAFRLPLATTAANVNIYTDPSTASTIKQALSAKGTRVCGFNTIKDANNKTWYPDHYACFCRKS